MVAQNKDNKKMTEKEDLVYHSMTYRDTAYKKIHKFNILYKAFLDIKLKFLCKI